jgi:hypothetical protein
VKDAPQIRALVEDASRLLFEHQPNIFDYTSATGQTEWNLAHHLAWELRHLLPSFDCDLDVTKHNFENRRPDVIFHKRGTHRANYLVIEIKYDGGVTALEHDVEKIRDYWFREPLSYTFGAVVNLRSDRIYEVHAFRNDALEILNES